MQSVTTVWFTSAGTPGFNYTTPGFNYTTSGFVVTVDYILMFSHLALSFYLADTLILDVDLR